jgi:hypothetical protein
MSSVAIVSQSPADPFYEVIDNAKDIKDEEFESILMANMEQLGKIWSQGRTIFHRLVLSRAPPSWIGITLRIFCDFEERIRQSIDFYISIKSVQEMILSF